MTLQEALQGFYFNGVWITDINYDESGRFEVDPYGYYNIKKQ